MKAFVFLTYADDSEVYFEFKCDDSDHDAYATLLMVCRGTLMASVAVKVTAYDEEGFERCQYVR